MVSLGGSSIRVRVHFDYPPPAVVDCRMCWLLVDLNTCRVVADLESMIRDKFGFGRRSILNLFIEDCYLPHTESVYVVRDNDCVRVKVDSLPQVNGDSLHPEPSRETCRKRPRPPEGDRLTGHGAIEELKKKKRKKSREENVESDVKQTSSDESKKKKKKKSGGTDIEEKKKKKKKKVEGTEPEAKKTPTKVELVQNKNKTPQTRTRKNVSSSDSSSSEEDQAPKKPQKPAPKPPAAAAAAAASKAPQKKSQPPPSSSSSSSSSSDEAASTMLQKKPQAAAGSRSGSKPQPPPTAPPPPPPPLRPADATRPPSDSEEEEIQLVIKRPMHPPGFGFSQTTGAPSSCWGRGRGRGGRGGAGQRGRGDGRGGCFRGNGGGGRGSFTSSSNGATEPSYETDSLTNTSVVVQNAPRPDYSSLPLLAAPPQVGQKIAFKLLELTENYTPEVSEYKEATIVSFDHSSRQMELELQSSCQAPTEPGKFDLVYQNPDGSERVEYAVSRSSRVTERWDSLLEPRLII